MLSVGSVATHTCDRENGYVLSGVDVSVIESTRTCALSGWSGTEITCECKCIIMYLLQAVSYYRETIPVCSKKLHDLCILMSVFAFLKIHNILGGPD